MMGLDTRRHFLRLAMGGALGGTAAAATCNTKLQCNQLKPLPKGDPTPLPPEPKRVPRPLASSAAGKAALGQLKDAYDQLLARDPAKQNSLLYQMSLHDLYCSNRTGTADIHSSWDFLPWHRGFVYFHERILRAIIGDSFRLPVWDWDNPGADKVPDFYTSWARNNICKHTRDDLDGRVSQCSQEAWLFSPTYQEFAGYKPYAMGPHHALRGSAPNGPHSYVHSYIGGALSLPCTAAADPLFYAHHANVDRFWKHWQKSTGFRPPQGFGGQVFCFYDEHCQPWFVRAIDLAQMDEGRLGYCYADLPNVPVPNPSDPAAVLFQGPILTVRSLGAILKELLSKPDLKSALASLVSMVFHIGSAVSINLPFRISWQSQNLEPGQFYFIALASAQDPQDQKLIGGFGQFADPGDVHGSDQVVATGCLGLEHLLWAAQRITNGKMVQLIYGQPDENMVTIPVPKTFWPTDFTVLRSHSA
jgi:hypothetical protein